MQIPSAQADIAGAMVDHAAQLSSRSEKARLENIDHVAEEFEAVFMSMLIKQMRETLPEGGFFGSESSDSFGGLFDLYMGQHMSKSGDIGIGSMVKKYLNNRLDPVELPGPKDDA